MHSVLSKHSEVSKAMKDQLICTSISKLFQRVPPFPGGGGGTPDQSAF